MNTNTQTNQGIIKRVPLDFSWPIGKEWPGHQNPHLDERVVCDACDGTGVSVARLRLGDIVSLLMMSATETITQESLYSHQRETFLYRTQGKIPGKDMLQLTGGLAGRSLRDHLNFHDSLDCVEASRKIISAAGLPTSWGYCPICNGEGEVFTFEKDKKASDEWVPQQPPVGEGYQLWDSFMPGAPISPVFSKPEEFALYLANTQTKTRLTYENWLKVIKGELFIKG